MPFTWDFTFQGHRGCSHRLGDGTPHHNGSPISFFRLLKFFSILSWYLFP